MHQTLLNYINRAGQLYHQMLAPARETSGLSQAELDILLFLYNNPEYDTASDMVSIRRLAKSNVSVGVKSLTAKGLLLRRPDERDRRVEHLTLTSAAAPVAELGRSGQESFAQALTQGFTPEDRSELKRLMERIHQNLDQALDHLD